MALKFVGRHLTVWFAEGGSDEGLESLPSWCEAVSHLQSGKVESTYARMRVQLQRLADGASLRNPDRFNTEGELPDGKHFFAVKVGQIRAYGWYSTKYKRAFIVSHFVFKKKQKLDAADIRRVHTNWKRIEREKS